MYRATAVLLLVIAVAGCGHRSSSASDVIRAWSAAIDRNDNDAAAALFADGATVVQGDALRLPNHRAAVRWNASLPCAGAVEEIRTEGRDLLAIFRLGRRPHHTCDAPGTEAAALFRVVDGKIVLWHQTPVPEIEGELSV